MTVRKFNYHLYWSDIEGNERGREKTVPVRSFGANPWGLFEVHGNVWEWCADDYDAKYYSESPDNNPTGLEDAIIFEGNDFTGVESA